MTNTNISIAANYLRRAVADIQGRIEELKHEDGGQRGRVKPADKIPRLPRTETSSGNTIQPETEPTVQPKAEKQTTNIGRLQGQIAEINRLASRLESWYV